MIVIKKKKLERDQSLKLFSSFKVQTPKEKNFNKIQNKMLLDPTKGLLTSKLVYQALLSLMLSSLFCILYGYDFFVLFYLVIIINHWNFKFLFFNPKSNKIKKNCYKNDFICAF